jgi:DNA primase
MMMIWVMVMMFVLVMCVEDDAVEQKHKEAFASFDAFAAHMATTAHQTCFKALVKTKKKKKKKKKKKIFIDFNY